MADENRTPEPLIPGILGQTNTAGTTNERNALRCAGSQEFDLHAGHAYTRTSRVRSKDSLWASPKKVQVPKICRVISSRVSILAAGEKNLLTMTTPWSSKRQ
jgi:hypothetical protein